MEDLVVESSMNMNIREATTLDCDSIHHLYCSALDEQERELVSKLATELLAEKSTLKIISLVAEIKRIVVGHIACSPVSIPENKSFRGYILAPLAVLPAYQKRLIGSRLVNCAIACLEEMNVDILFVYGDPNYYGRFSFSSELAINYIPPYKLQYPFGWQARVFKEATLSKFSVNITCVDSLSDPALW